MTDTHSPAPKAPDLARIREALDEARRTRATDFVEAAFPGWAEKVDALLADLSLPAADADEAHEIIKAMAEHPGECIIGGLDVSDVAKGYLAARHAPPPTGITPEGGDAIYESHHVAEASNMVGAARPLSEWVAEGAPSVDKPERQQMGGSFGSPPLKDWSDEELFQACDEHPVNRVSVYSEELRRRGWLPWHGGDKAPVEGEVDLWTRGGTHYRYHTRKLLNRAWFRAVFGPPPAPASAPAGDAEVERLAMRLADAVNTGWLHLPEEDRGSLLNRGHFRRMARMAIEEAALRPASEEAVERAAEAIKELDGHITASAHYSGYVNGISRRELISWRAILASAQGNNRGAKLHPETIEKCIKSMRSRASCDEALYWAQEFEKAIRSDAQGNNGGAK